MDTNTPFSPSRADNATTFDNDNQPRNEFVSYAACVLSSSSSSPPSSPHNDNANDDEANTKNNVTNSSSSNDDAPAPVAAAPSRRWGDDADDVTTTPSAVASHTLPRPPPQNHNTRWMPADDAFLAQELASAVPDKAGIADDLTLRALADKLQRTVHAINNRRRVIAARAMSGTGKSLTDAAELVRMDSTKLKVMMDEKMATKAVHRSIRANSGGVNNGGGGGWTSSGGGLFRRHNTAGGSLYSRANSGRQTGSSSWGDDKTQQHWGSGSSLHKNGTVSKSNAFSSCDALRQRQSSGDLHRRVSALEYRVNYMWQQHYANSSTSATSVVLPQQQQVSAAATVV